MCVKRNEPCINIFVFLNILLNKNVQQESLLISEEKNQFAEKVGRGLWRVFTLSECKTKPNYLIVPAILLEIEISILAIIV